MMQVPDHKHGKHATQVSAHYEGFAFALGEESNETTDNITHASPSPSGPPAQPAPPSQPLFPPQTLPARTSSATVSAAPDNSQNNAAKKVKKRARDRSGSHYSGLSWVKDTANNDTDRDTATLATAATAALPPSTSETHAAEPQPQSHANAAAAPPPPPPPPSSSNHAPLINRQGTFTEAQLQSTLAPDALHSAPPPPPPSMSASPNTAAPHIPRQHSHMAHAQSFAGGVGVYAAPPPMMNRMPSSMASYSVSNSQQPQPQHMRVMTQPNANMLHMAQHQQVNMMPQQPQGAAGTRAWPAAAAANMTPAMYNQMYQQRMVWMQQQQQQQQYYRQQQQQQGPTTTNASPSDSSNESADDESNDEDEDEDEEDEEDEADGAASEASQDKLGDSYANTTATVPALPHLSPTAAADTATPTEVKRLKQELAHLKREHEQETLSFQTTVDRLKKEQVRKTSMQIDDELVTREIAREKEDRVHALEQAFLAEQTAEHAELAQLQLKHSNDVKKYEYQVRQQEQLHVLEVKNLQSKQAYEQSELGRQIRSLNGALRVQADKDKQIELLSTQNEQLGSDKARIVDNYEQSIARMNEQTEAAIQERVRKLGALQREILELRASATRQQTNERQLEQQCEQYRAQVEDKARLIAQLQFMYEGEKKKHHRARHKLMRAKQTRGTREEDGDAVKKRRRILESGGHVRKPSKGLHGRVTTQYKLDTGETVVEIENQNVSDLMTQQTWESDFDISDDDSPFDDDNHKNHHDDEEIVLKRQEIESLQEQIRNLQSNLASLKQSCAQEVQAAQQKIGSLQQQLRQEQDQYLKQREMFEFKFAHKQGALQTAEQQLQDVRQSYSQQVRSLHQQVAQLKQALTEQEDTNASLEQHVDMLQSENGRLKEYEQELVEYEQDMDALDREYQEMLDAMRQQHDEEQTQLRMSVQDTEHENESLQSTVHAHRSTITSLEQTLSRMQEAEQQIVEKEKELDRVMQAQQQQQLSIVEEEEEEADDEHAMTELRQQLSRVQGNNALQADLLREAEGKLSKEQERYSTDMQRWRDENTRLEAALKDVECTRITLLTKFATEMDRMRDEIRKTNGSRRCIHS